MRISCDLPDFFKQYAPPSSGCSSENNEDMEDYAPGWTSGPPVNSSAFRFKSKMELDGEPTSGLLATYLGGGYVVELGIT